MMSKVKEWGWVGALVLLGYVLWITVMPYKRALEAHEVMLAQWGQCLKVNQDHSLTWICEMKGEAKAAPVTTTTTIPITKK